MSYLCHIYRERATCSSSSSNNNRKKKNTTKSLDCRSVCVPLHMWKIKGRERLLTQWLHGLIKFVGPRSRTYITATIWLHDFYWKEYVFIKCKVKPMLSAKQFLIFFCGFSRAAHSVYVLLLKQLKRFLTGVSDWKQTLPKVGMCAVIQPSLISHHQGRPVAEAV